MPLPLPGDTGVMGGEGESSIYMYIYIYISTLTHKYPAGGEIGTPGYLRASLRFCHTKTFTAV